MLLDEGYDVVACDVYPDQFKLTEISCDFVDLNNKLEFFVYGTCRWSGSNGRSYDAEF